MTCLDCGHWPTADGHHPSCASRPVTAEGPPPGCHCGQPWNSVLPPPPCPHHTTTPAFYGGVHALERALLRKLLATSFVAQTDAGPRLFFSADWMDISVPEAALLHSLEN